MYGLTTLAKLNENNEEAARIIAEANAKKTPEQRAQDARDRKDFNARLTAGLSKKK